MSNNRMNLNNSKEIIVVTVEIGLGGAERVLTELMKEWVHKGNAVTLIQTKPGIYGHSYTVDKDIRLVSFKSRGHTKVSRYFHETTDLLKYLKKHPNATVVAFVNPSIRIVAACSLFVRNRVVFSERCDPRFTPPSRLMRWLRDRLFRFASVCVFQTEDAMKLFPKGVQKKGIVIPNPVNPDMPPVTTMHRNKVIMTACRLSTQKNLPMLIKAFSGVVKDYPEYSLHIYGTGEERDNLQKLIEKYDLEGKAKLIGHSSDIFHIMQESAMYVCSSNYEGISNSLLEALCMGMPVISTDHPIGGAKVMISDQENGLLVPVGDDEEMCSAMKYLIEHPETAERLGENAKKIRERWPVDKIADRWLSVFNIRRGDDDDRT